MSNLFKKFVFTTFGILLFLLSDNIIAQQRKIDSLKKLLSTSLTENERANALMQLSVQSSYAGNFEEAIPSGKKAIGLFTKLKDIKNIALSNRGMGLVYMYAAAYDSSLKYFDRALVYYKEKNDKNEISSISISIGMINLDKGDPNKAMEYCNKGLALVHETKNVRGIADALVNISNIFYSKSDYPQTLECLFKASTIYDSLDNKDNVCVCLVNMGIIYSTQKDYTKALSYFQRTLTINKQNKNRFAITGSLGNIAGVYLNTSKYDSALYFSWEALKIEREIGAKPDEAFTLNTIATIYLHKNNADSTLFYSLESIKIFKEIGNKQSLATTLNTLARAYLMKNNTDLSLKYAQESSAMANEVHSDEEIKEAEKTLSEVYSKLNKPALAFEHYKKFIELRDSLYSTENTKLIIQKDMNFDFEKQKEKLRVEQEKKDIENQLAQKQQRLVIIFVIAGLLLVSFFSIFLLKRYRITQKQKRIIENQKHLLEEKNKEVHDSITYAKRLQEAILPPHKLISSHFSDNFILYKPKDIVAGDFYWAEFINEKFYIAAADSTGHGVPGAMVSVVCSNALNRSVKEFKENETGKILDKTRELVIETFEKSESEVKDGMDISLLCVDLKNKKITWSGANNPLWYIFDNELKEIKPDKQPIGKTYEPKPFKTHAIEFKEGTAFYLFTDGFADQFGGPDGKKFMSKNLKELLLSITHLSPNEQKNSLGKTLSEWKGIIEQVDDITVIGFKI